MSVQCEATEVKSTMGGISDVLNSFETGMKKSSRLYVFSWRRAEAIEEVTTAILES